MCDSHITEDQCWDFLATHMAPLTSTEQPEQLLQARSGVATQLFEELAERVDDIPKHKVYNVILICVLMHA